MPRPCPDQKVLPSGGHARPGPRSVVTSAIVPLRWARAVALGSTLVAVTLGGCTSTQMKRATYQVLRQGDCELNGLDGYGVDEFCDRNFSAEYHRYDQLRNDFLHERRREIVRETSPGSLAAF